MTLKGLATQLECQGVDPGYVQTFDWESWILRSYLMEDLGYTTVKENTKRTKSLVLYLLQEYSRVVNVEYVKTLQEKIDDLKGELEDSRSELRAETELRDPVPFG